MHKSISAVLIPENEECCISSIYDIVDEIIVTDLHGSIVLVPSALSVSDISYISNIEHIFCFGKTVTEE